MRILHLNEHLGWFGGIETYLLSLVPRLAESGTESTIAYATGEEIGHSMQMPILAEASQKAQRIGFQAMQDLLHGIKPDVVHIHNIHNVGAIAACLDQGPTILHAHDYRYICPTSALFHRRTRQICGRTCGLGCFTTTLRAHCLTPRPIFAMRYYRRVRWTMSNADRFTKVVAPSEYVAARFAQAGFLRQQIEVLPYFCPIAPLSAESARREPSTPTVLFVGRFREVKGLDVLVRAIGRLPKQVRGLFVGDCTAPQREVILSLAIRHGCEDRINIEPWASRESISSIYARATVFVFPSIWAETLGIVGLEAMASRLPVVASDVGGVRQWLRDGETGLLVPPDDPVALAAAILRLVENPAMRATMGTAGAETIASDFSPSGHVKQLLQVYRSAIAGS